MRVLDKHCLDLQHFITQKTQKLITSLYNNIMNELNCT